MMILRERGRARSSALTRPSSDSAARELERDRGQAPGDRGASVRIPRRRLRHGHAWRRIAPTFTINGLLFNFVINDPEAIAADTSRIDYTVFGPISGQRVFLEERGSRTYPDRVTLDLHLERGFHLGRAEWVLSLDGFNVLGNRVITEANVAIDSQSDPNATGSFASARGRVPPRTIRLGTAVRF